MTSLTASERASSDRLDFFHGIEEQLELEDSLSLRAYLIGALSAAVDDETWGECLSVAVESLAAETAHKRT